MIPSRGSYHAVFFTDISTPVHGKTLGAFRLASELRSHGYRVLVIDYLGRWLLDYAKFKQLLNNIISQDTLFVGYSGTFLVDPFATKNNAKWPQTGTSIQEVNQYIKNLNNNVKIIYGGARANSISDDLLDCNLDYIVQGFADTVIVDIAHALKQGRTPQFSNKIKDVKIINHDAKGLSFNFRDRSTTTYTADDFIIPGETLPIEISRGCMFKCSFCSFPLLGRSKQDLSYIKDPTVLTRELANNYEKFNTINYMITDDTFNETTEKLLTIKHAIEESGVKIRFFAYLRADLLARFPEQQDILIDMGLMTGSFGIETLNYESAKAIGKGMHPDRVKECLIEFKRKGQGQINTHGNFIVGLPHDSEESINQEMSWVFDNPDFLDTFHVTGLNLRQGDIWTSEISSDPEKYGYEIWENGRYWKNDYMTSQKALEISKYWSNKCHQAGRQKIGSMFLMAALNFGYTYEELNSLTTNNIPWDDIKLRALNHWENYKLQVLNRLT